MGIIYKLTFSNDKIYIGMTKTSLEQRLRSHRADSARSNPKLAVHRAWKKHGAPVATALAVVENEDLAATEVRAIRAFDSFRKGYNLTPGGEASPMLVPAVVEKVRALALTPERIARNIEVHLGSRRSKETRDEMSRVRKGQGLGIPKSAEHCAAISAALKKLGHTYVATAEHRAKISAANLGRKFTDAHKAKIAAVKRGSRLSDETRAKLSIAAKARWAAVKVAS